MFLLSVTTFIGLVFAALMTPPGKTYSKMFMTRTNLCVRGTLPLVITIGVIMKIVAMLETGLPKYYIARVSPNISRALIYLRIMNPLKAKNRRDGLFQICFIRSTLCWTMEQNKELLWLIQLYWVEFMVLRNQMIPNQKIGLGTIICIENLFNGLYTWIPMKETMLRPCGNGLKRLWNLQPISIFFSLQDITCS